jgi:hypothetical protein
MGYKLTKQNNDDPSSNGLLGLPSASNKNREDATIVSECASHCHSYISAFEEVKCGVVDKDVLNDSVRSDRDSFRLEAAIWELMSSSPCEHEDVDGEHESSDISAATEVECEVMDKDVSDDSVLSDSDYFRGLRSTPEQNDASRKHCLFQDGADDQDTDDKLRQLHEKRARREASLFASPPDQHYAALQELRRKRPVCLFVNFLGTRCPQVEDSKLLSSTAVITTETRVSSLKVSAISESESEPSDLPTKSVSLITTVPKTLDAPSPLLVTPEGLKMLEALGLSICPCKMNKKDSTMSFQTSEDPSLASCCFPGLPLLAPTV